MVEIFEPVSAVVRYRLSAPEPPLRVEVLPTPPMVSAPSPATMDTPVKLVATEILSAEPEPRMY